MKKLTKAQKFNAIKTMLDEGKDTIAIGEATFSKADATEFIDAELALLAKKNSGDAKKPTKAQQENAVLKAAIVKFLSVNPGVTATDVMNGCNLASNQKAAALLRALKDEGIVEKVITKNKALFSLVPGYVVEDTEDAA